MKSAAWPRNVVVAKRDAVPWASGCENLPIGNGHLFVNGAAKSLSERVFTQLYAFYEPGRGGIVREPEGIETPLPGKSSERAWSMH